MTDIEERAEEYCNNYTGVCELPDIFKSYVESAIDQQRIDIEKACKCLTEFLEDKLNIWIDDEMMYMFKQAMEE